ncbi:MAG: hypothetical protein FRX49_05059 [Trebouxia sp. A1-2]|nr:MAG: hypothetical protein FRX49_05059 [Trebouxia sp. A1-2]
MGVDTHPASASHVLRRSVRMVQGTPSASAMALSLAACWLKADKPSHEPTLLPATVRSISARPIPGDDVIPEDNGCHMIRA